MNLLDHPIWGVIIASFAPDIQQRMGSSVLETLYTVALFSAIMLFCGLLLGILLTVTNPNGLVSLRLLYVSSGWLINCLRSLPRMIMIILMIPVACLFFGKSYSTSACIITVAASCIPMYARIAENSLLEIAKGKVEAAKSVGSTNAQIISRTPLPETIPSLTRGFTVVVIVVISMTALTGMFGAGSIGDIAVRFGYQRSQYDMLFAAIYILIILVQLVQWVRDLVSKQIPKERNLTQNLSINQIWT